MANKKLSTFVRDNKVILVMVPFIIGMHWGWYELQKVPYLVPPTEEKKEFPIIGAFKAYKAKFFGKSENVSNEDDSGK